MMGISRTTLLPAALRLLALPAFLWLALIAGSVWHLAWADMTAAEALAAGKGVGSSGAAGFALPAVDATTLPGFTTASPPETAYQGAGMGLEDAGRTKMLTASPTTPEGTAFSSITTRPQFHIGRTDPLVKYTDGLYADAEANAGKGASGTKCRTMTVTDPPKSGTDTCMEYLKPEDSTCKRTLAVACTAHGGGSCDANVTLIAVNGTNSITQRKEGNTLIFRITQVIWWWWYAYPLRMDIIDPSKVKSISVYAASSLEPTYLAVGTDASTWSGDNVVVGWLYPDAYGHNLSDILKTHPYLSFWRSFVGYAGSWVELAIEQDCGCSGWQDTWTDSCSLYTTNPLCEAKGSTCTDSANPRIIEGQPVTRTCWEYTDSYQCYNNTGSKSEDDYCAELRAAGCTQSGSTCNDEQYGRCVAWEQTYQCNIPGTARTEEDCSSANVCQDGNCFDQGYDKNTDFGVAASSLSAVEAMAKDFDPASLKIFSGGDYRCKQEILGFSNCCKNSGWGKSIGLAKCGEQEKVLAAKLGAGMCVYIGQYSKGKIFKTTYRTWCCFNSKLARIIHEQGRRYVPLGWGGPEGPECRGFTPEELDKVDFGKIDFSEFFGDALAAADAVTKPGASNLGTTLQDKIRALLPK